MSGEIDATLDCGCSVTVREEWFVYRGGELTHLCDTHSSGELESVRFQLEETQRELSHLRLHGPGHEMERW